MIDAKIAAQIGVKGPKKTLKMIWANSITLEEPNS